MKYCANCGNELVDEAVVCPKCGVACEIVKPNTPAEENNALLFGAIGCCVPIVGLILWLVWKDSKPKTAKYAGIGALISVICIIIYYVFVAAVVGTQVAGYYY